MLTSVKKNTRRIVSVITAVVIACVMMCVPNRRASAEGYSTDELKDMANQIAYLINEARIKNGLKPLYVVPYLNDVAQVRSREVIFSFSHSRPDGSRFSSIIDTSLVDYSFAAENLAAGSFNAKDTFEQWKGSERHWEIINNENLTHMGVGCSFEQNSDYGMYWQITLISTMDEYENQYLPTKYKIEPKADGDVNGDSVINTYDYLTLLDYLQKKKDNYPCYLNPEQLETSDCFVDGIINESDAKVMRRYLLGEYKSIRYVF